jgi:hypothetical protein
MALFIGGIWRGTPNGAIGPTVTFRQSAPISSWPGIAARRTASLSLAYDPAIHVLAATGKKDVDARDKPTAVRLRISIKLG